MTCHLCPSTKYTNVTILFLQSYSNNTEKKHAYTCVLVKFIIFEHFKYFLYKNEVCFSQSRGFKFQKIIWPTRRPKPWGLLVRHYIEVNIL